MSFDTVASWFEQRLQILSESRIQMFEALVPLAPKAIQTLPRIRS